MSEHLTDAERDALLDRELGPAAEMAALEHLLLCRECREAHGGLVEAASLAAAYAPPPRPRRARRILVFAAAAVAAIVALVFFMVPPRRREPLPEPRPSAELHRLVVVTTREAGGTVSRETRRAAPDGALERSRERIRPHAEGHVLMALRRSTPAHDGGISR